MKKSLLLLLFLILLIASFRGGTWYSQRWVGGNDESSGERKILHYVDPMNPANVSSEPGLAPCGMPMEPVYDDRETDGPRGNMSLGAVKVPSQRQQIIGLKIGTAKKASETHRIRTLGRVTADENRIFPLVSAADGWMSYIPGSTTGSLVEKGQLMALIHIYDYDFFSWQQRYLSELTNLAQRYFPATNFTGARQPLPYPSQGKHSATQSKTQSNLGMPFSAMQPKFALPKSPPINTSQSGTPPSHKRSAHGAEMSSMGNMEGHSMIREAERRAGDLDPSDMREDDILYANKAKLELRDLGVDRTQLRRLAREGKYIPNIEIRSPVTGLVIKREISPLEKVFRGTECFRVADLSRVWILADVFNDDARYIHPGMRARISLPRHNQEIEAVVSDIFPEFDGNTRTLKVRLEMKNPKYAFRPDMFVDVDFLVSLPPALTVPTSAVLDSGRRKIVFVSPEEGYFEPREVVTGWRFDDRVEILQGLVPGEKIVISGNFLIDSESRMKLATAGLMAKPESEEAPPDKEKADVPSRGESGHD